MDAVRAAFTGDYADKPDKKDQDAAGKELRAIESRTGQRRRDDLNHDAQRELQQLRTTLQNNIQSSRMQHHAFEPLSLPGSQPASRVPSGSNTPQRRQLNTGSENASPKQSPPASAVHSPPLTPAPSRSKDGGKPPTSAPAVRAPQDIMTPQRSASPQRSGVVAPVSSHPRSQPSISIAPRGDSAPPSQDASPRGTPASTAPGTPRPFTPTAEASTKRLASAQSYDPKYRFGDRDPAAGFANSGTGPSLPANAPGQPKTNAGQVQSAQKQEEHKRSGFFSAPKREDTSESTATIQERGHHHSGSKSNLKRFFKFGDHKHKHGKEEKDTSKEHKSSKDGSAPATQTTTGDAPSVPFADDHGLSSKYGKFGKMLGSGAGGSVRLMKRSGDGTVFAVKQFRDRHAYESEKEYNKKVTAEFCIGSTLHHGNIIETIDIVYEKGRWYEVMEYAPYDLFATVMTGKMGRDEITCSTLQILSGVLYLHSMGLAHRDLKLDNVVINEHGIMKLIDFGSAVVFRYPFENDIVLATGVVGSDPYLAPEVYDHSRYDPRPADIWSIAIIFCCMTLRRFPWKAPRISDNSYRLFVSPPDADQDKALDQHRKSLSTKSGNAAPPSRKTSAEEQANGSEQRPQKNGEGNPDSQPTIKGPVRLLRLLPRETRHIIGRMLELDPRKRATMDEILEDNWVQNAYVCRQEENGVIIRAPNHTHALQPSNAGN